MISLPRPILMLIMDPSRELPDLVREAVAGGVNAVMLRQRDEKDAEADEDEHEIRAITRGTAALVLNGYSIMSVKEVEADGLHLPEDRPLRQVESIFLAVGRGRLLGRSVHSIGAAIRAEQESCDYLVAGSIYPTATHPGRRPAGLGFLKTVCDAVRIPVLAVGGITPGRVDECIGAGADGVAVVSGIMEADDPREAARRYRDALNRAWFREA